MGTPLKKPPVYFTVLQVRFNAILNLTEYLPSIQDQMRKSGYPDYEAKRQMVINISSQDGVPTPTPGTAERHFFGTTDKMHRFVLTGDFLALQSSNYGTYEQFSAKFLEGISFVHQVVKLDYTDRIGLRYLDQVAPKSGDDLNKYLVPEAQGLGVRLGGKQMHSFIETLTTFDRVNLLSRVIIQDAGLPFPPDLQPEGMEINDRFTSYSGRNAAIDTDGFIEGRDLFSLDELRQKLEAIHEVVRKAFRHTVTDHAFNVWDEK